MTTESVSVDLRKDNAAHWDKENPIEIGKH